MLLLKKSIRITTESIRNQQGRHEFYLISSPNIIFGIVVKHL